MATTKKQAEKPQRQFESELGKLDKIKTGIYTTDPKTVITIEGKIDNETNLELRYAVDALLKAKGY